MITTLIITTDLKLNALYNKNEDKQLYSQIIKFSLLVIQEVPEIHSPQSHPQVEV